MNGAAAVEVAEVERAVPGERQPGEEREPAAWLERDLEQHGERHHARVVGPEVPRRRRHVVLHLRAHSGLAEAGPAVHANDARHEVIRRRRQVSHEGRAVHGAVRPAEGIRRLAERAVHERAVPQLQAVDGGDRRRLAMARQ